MDGEDDIHNGFLLTVSVERIEDKNGARVIAIGGRPLLIAQAETQGK